MGTERTNPTPAELVVIARNPSGQIITNITSHRDLVGAIHTARCMLQLKAEAERAEVHHREHMTSNYSQKPLAVLSRDDLPTGPMR